MKHLPLIAALALAGCGGAIDVHDRKGEERLTIHYDEGGSIRAYRNEVGRALFYGTDVHIAGPCISACTMYLALGPDQLTVHPKAPFYFHGGRATEEGMEVLKNHYPPNLREWFTENAQHHVLSDVKLTGQELHEMDPDHVRLRE